MNTLNWILVLTPAIFILVGFTSAFFYIRYNTASLVKVALSENRADVNMPSLNATEVYVWLCVASVLICGITFIYANGVNGWEVELEHARLGLSVDQELLKNAIKEVFE